jgi:hypothetical protein
MNHGRARTASARSRHLRLLHEAGIPVLAPGQDCDHPVGFLRFDGLQETRGEHALMAWVTCMVPDCFCSFLIPVRGDVTHHAGQDLPDSDHNGGPLAVDMAHDTTPEPARSTKNRGHELGGRNA